MMVKNIRGEVCFLGTTNSKLTNALCLP